MRSLRFKILALAALLVALTQVGTVATVLFTANRDVTARAHERLKTGGAVFDEMMRNRADTLRNTVRILASDSTFRQAVTAGDGPTIVEVLRSHSETIDADISILLDPAGRVLATTRSVAPERIAFPGLIHSANQRAVSRATIDANGATYEMVTVPVEAPVTVAWVSMGFQIDDRFAALLHDLTGLQISLVADRGETAEMLGSSLPKDDAEMLAAKLKAVRLQSSMPKTLSLGPSEYLGLHRPFIPGGSEISVLLKQSLHQAMEPYRMLRLATIFLGSAALVLALLGAIGLSRTVTEPISRLAGAARRIRVGDYGSRVEVDSRDELGELADAFNAMQDSIAEREERITYQAQFDSLTGLPNRFLALERLAGALASRNGDAAIVSLLVVDLGNLSEIGSSLGHEIGDALLSQAAERLRSSLDARHTLARLEGDEFLVVMPGVDVDAACETAEDLLRLLGAGLSVHDVNMSVQSRIGIASAPRHGTDPDQLLLRAAVAKNDAKTAQRHVHVYEDGREEQNLRQLAILGDLRRATRHDELKLFLQPKVQLADGAICGAEALVRWEHPTLGFLPPGDFIPIAEKSGNISLITHWALTAAVRECRLLLEDGLDVPVSVNLSGRDLQNRNLPYLILEILRDHDLDARYLTLEITEEALVGDFDNATLVLECLRDLGTRISIDDFGTGYSSLAQIRNLPIDELKIDRSFVMQLPDNREDVAIVRAAIELAHSLGLEAVAEGVETRPAMRWLAEQGCERAQGFLFSRPMPAESFSAWVRESGRADPASPGTTSTSRRRLA